MKSDFKNKPINQFEEFFKSEQSSGFILIGCTLLSLLLANSTLGDTYQSFWDWELGPEKLGLHMSVSQWINSGLISIFFLFIGLEIKREFVVGELSTLKKAMLPVMASLGGMIVSATFYTLFNWGTDYANGWGIPMATDIAFAIGILALLGNQIPSALKVLLISIAIIDDICAVLVIALFYTDEVTILYLIIACVLYSVLLILNKFNVKALWIYLVLGVILWYLVLKSGVSPAIAGVFLAMALPLEKGSNVSVAERMEHMLEVPVAYIIIPLFVLCNTAFELSASFRELVSLSVVQGVVAGLLLGKPLGIFSFSYLSVKSGLTKLPTKISFYQIIGIGFLGGIGFTMAIFISLLVFENSSILPLSKIAILIGSVLSGLIGYIILRRDKVQDMDT